MRHVLYKVYELLITKLLQMSSNVERNIPYICLSYILNTHN